MKIDLKEILKSSLENWASKNDPLNNEIPLHDAYINAMKEACIKTIDLCAEKQAEVYKEMGYTNTGKKIAETIINLKVKIG